jgi:hypothetical protein
VARSQGSGRVRYRLHISTYGNDSYSTIITIGPSLMGLRGTQLTGSIIYTLVTDNPRCRIAPTKMPQRAAHQPHCSSIHLQKATPPTRERHQDAAVAQSDGFGFSPGKERGGGGRYTSTTPLRRGSTHRVVVVVTNRWSGVSPGQSSHPRHPGRF